MLRFNINSKKNILDNQYPCYLWHCRLGYINETRTTKLHKEWYLVYYKSYETCKACLLGKIIKTPFTKSVKYLMNWFVSYMNIHVLPLMTILDMVMCIW